MWGIPHYSGHALFSAAVAEGVAAAGVTLRACVSACLECSTRALAAAQQSLSDAAAVRSRALQLLQRS